MKITSVEYAKLYNLGDYQHHRISATAELNGDDPAITLAELREWIDARHNEIVGQHQAVADAEEQESRLRAAQFQLKAEIESMARRWDGWKKFLDKLGEYTTPRTYAANYLRAAGLSVPGEGEGEGKGETLDDIPY